MHVFHLHVWLCLFMSYAAYIYVYRCTYKTNVLYLCHSHRTLCFKNMAFVFDYTFYQLNKKRVFNSMRIADEFVVLPKHTNTQIYYYLSVVCPLFISYFCVFFVAKFHVLKYSYVQRTCVYLIQMYWEIMRASEPNDRLEFSTLFSLLATIIRITHIHIYFEQIPAVTAP